MNKNLNHLTDLELLNYLDLTSSDPIVLRLVNMLIGIRGGIVGELVEIGMDPATNIFTVDYQDYSPAEYIQHLESNTDWLEDELVVSQREVQELREEVKRLKIRSVVDILSEAKSAIRTAESLTRDAVKAAEKAQDENKILKEQLGIWNTLKTV